MRARIELTRIDNRLVHGQVGLTSVSYTHLDVYKRQVYRFILTVALQLGIGASDLNLFSAALVALAISLPHLKKRRRGTHA